MSDQAQQSTEGQGTPATTGEPTTLLGGAVTPPAENNTDGGEGTPTTKTGEGEGTKADGQKDGEGKKVGEVDKGQVPEKYDFKLPENVKIGDEMMGKFTTTAKELGLSNDKAQQLVDLAIENVTEALKNNVDAWDNARKGWVDRLKIDKDFGGDNYDKTIAHAKSALSRFSSPDFVSFLEETGFGDSDHLIKFLAKVNQAIGDDKIHEGGAAISSKTDGEIVYGKQ